MRIITEIELRDRYAKEKFDNFKLVYPEKLTPSAYEFLNERKIKIVEEPPCNISLNDVKSQDSMAFNDKKIISESYVLMDTGRTIKEKPEEYTHLTGRNLVLKNHKRIIFRGKVDSLEANLINTIIECNSYNSRELAEDLTIILEYTKKIMRAEVLEETLIQVNFKGWSNDEIRDYSHHPEKYFGVSHFVPDPCHGKILALLNIIRTQVRELEIVAVSAFYNMKKDSVDRVDIITGLNRLSSLVYIIMCRYLGGFYKN